MSITPYTECTRFERCSVNHCPLDPAQLESLADNPDPRCTLPKVRRMEIAKRYPDLLPKMGLRPLELNWELKPEEEKAKAREKGRALSAKYGFKPRASGVDQPNPGHDAPGGINLGDTAGFGQKGR